MKVLQKSMALEQTVNNAHRLVAAAMYLLQDRLTGDPLNPIDMADTILEKALEDMQAAVGAVSAPCGFFNGIGRN